MRHMPARQEGRMMSQIFSPLNFSRGPALANRLALAPLTNQQSHPDGTLSDEEFTWLTSRAQTGFGLTMTCAAHVHPDGQGFPGQLGIFSDTHIPGLTRLAAAIKAAGSISAIQLHHAGLRADACLAGQLVSASDDSHSGARGLTSDEVERCINNFVVAAWRAESAGFDGVEIHGAHGYLLAQFLSPETNRRNDKFGGTAEKRAFVLHEIINGIRRRCGDDFQLGLRLSTERYGIRFDETLELVQSLFDSTQLDYIDLSLWDAAKKPEDQRYQHATILAQFAKLRRGNTRLSCAGKFYDVQSIEAALSEGADFVKIGRAAILHHDFPARIRDDRNFRPAPLPVSRSYLQAEKLAAPFINYLSTMPGFLSETVE
jgi:2,4-dienoyl-CoA reductase-like NADH-dependent reductase (Old Yellow Enzyme family)